MNEQAVRREWIERLARRAAAAGMTAPALLFLETYKPLAYLGAQCLWAIQPFLAIWFKPAELAEIARLFEDRAAVDALVARLEALQSETARA